MAPSPAAVDFHSTGSSQFTVVGLNSVRPCSNQVRMQDRCVRDRRRGRWWESGRARRRWDARAGCGWPRRRRPCHAAHVPSLPTPQHTRVARGNMFGERALPRFRAAVGSAYDLLAEVVPLGRASGGHAREDVDYVHLRAGHARGIGGRHGLRGKESMVRATGRKIYRQAPVVLPTRLGTFLLHSSQ